MAIFKYKILDSANKTLVGLIEAPNEDSAALTLRERGYSIISIKRESESKELRLMSFLNRVKMKDLVIFSRQFSVMISANVAIVQALRILIDQTENLTLKMAVSEIADEIDSGSRLSDALGKRSEIFSRFYVNVVKSGETSGKLDEVLNYLADEMEKDYDITSKVKGAMIYPAIIFLGLSTVGAIMMISVVPKLTGMLLESGQELPWTTKLLIGVSDVLSKYWVLILIFIGIAVFGFSKYNETPSGRRRIDSLKLSLPVFGKLLQRIYLVRFTRSMGTLIVGGVAITKSLGVAAEVIDNQVYRDLIAETSKAVEDGSSISSVFSKSNQIPKMVSQMMSVGEKTGKLDLVLEKISSFYTREINNIIANLMTLMEPLVMIIIGIAVGIMVAAIILPMYNMASGM